jgi:hypothetical protein
VKVAAMTDKTHNPFDETYWVSCLRENFTSSSYGEELETGRINQAPRQFFTRQLVFRLWKTNLRIDESTSKQPWRILCEIYAKLLALLIQHWIMLTSCWQRKDRSIVKAFQVISQHATQLALTFDQPSRFEEALQFIARCLQRTCRQNSRRKHPNTWRTFEQRQPTWYTENAAGLS